MLLVQLPLARETQGFRETQSLAQQIQIKIRTPQSCGREVECEGAGAVSQVRRAQERGSGGLCWTRRLNVAIGGGGRRSRTQSTEQSIVSACKPRATRPSASHDAAVGKTRGPRIDAMLEQVDRLHEQGFESSRAIGPCSDRGKLREPLCDARGHATQGGRNVGTGAGDESTSRDRNQTCGRQQLATRVRCGIRARWRHRPQRERADGDRVQDRG